MNFNELFSKVHFKEYQINLKPISYYNKNDGDSTSNRDAGKLIFSVQQDAVEIRLALFKCAAAINVIE